MNPRYNHDKIIGEFKQRCRKIGILHFPCGGYFFCFSDIVFSTQKSPAHHISGKRKRSINSRQAKKKSISKPRCSQNHVRWQYAEIVIHNRIRPREEPLKLFTSRFISQFGKFLQEKEQITKRIKPIALGRLNHAKAQCTCISTLGCITKKKILPRHNKWLHGALCNVV